MSYFPSGEGTVSESSVLCSGKDVLVSAYEKTQNGFVLHMFNTSNAAQKVEISIPKLGICETLLFDSFELKLLKTKGNKLCE